MAYPVTTLAATILGMWLLVLSVRVIRGRRDHKVSLGDGGNEMLNRRIRAQGNLAEYGPFGLILMFLAESQGAWPWLVALIAGIFVVGRLLHGYAFSFTPNWAFGRFSGMLMTFTGLFLFAILNAALLVIQFA